MRVWVVDPGHQVPEYDRALAGALADLGCDVELWTAPGVRPPDGDPNPAVTRRLAYGRLWGRADGPSPAALARQWRRGVRAVGYPFEAASMLAFAARRCPDVLHLQWSLMPPIDALTLRRLRRQGVATVFTAHNVLPHDRRPWHTALWPPLHRSPDRVVVHSLATADRLRRISGVDAGRVRIVPMPSPRPEREWTRREARAWLLPALADDALVVLFVGQVRPYKGLDVLVAAMPRLRRDIAAAHLVVAGAVPGGERGAARLRARLASEVPVGWCTLRSGHRPREEFDALLAAADVVALPYHATDDSAVLGAALGSARAVVATAVGGLPEAVAGAGLLVAPDDPGALADGLARVLGDASLRRELESRARAVAAERSWGRTAELTRDVYREVTRQVAERRSGR